MHDADQLLAIGRMAAAQQLLDATEPFTWGGQVRGDAKALAAQADADVLTRAAKLARRAQPPPRWSMTLLRNASQCLLSARLDREGGGSGPEALWGRAFHEIANGVGFTCAMTGRPYVTPRELDVIIAGTLERFPDPLDPFGHELVVDWARWWGASATFPTTGYVGVEELWEHPLAGHPLSAKLDLVHKDEEVVEITDYKTGRHVPRSIYWSFQPRCYAWHAVQRWPDTGLVMINERYVRSGVPRSVVFTREYIDGTITPWLAGVLRRLVAAYATGRFDSQPGSWCSLCAQPEACPLPENTKEGAIASHNDLLARAGALLVLDARRDREMRMVRTHMKQWDVPPVAVGDKLLGRHTVTENRTDPKLLAEAGINLDVFKVPTDREKFEWHKPPQREAGDDQ